MFAAKLNAMRKLSSNNELMIDKLLLETIRLPQTVHER